MADAGEPVGLYLSLDDLIKSKEEERKKSQQQQQDEWRSHQRAQADSQRGRGRGPHQRGRGQRWTGPRGRNWEYEAPSHGYQQQEAEQQVYHQQRGGYDNNGFGNNGYGKQRRGAYGGGPQQHPYQQQQRAAPAERRAQQQMPQHDPHYYRQYQQCFEDEVTGDIVFQYQQTELIRISPTGDVALNSGGRHGPLTLASLNDGLNLIGIRVTAPSGDPKHGDWSISDGRSLTRFFDGVVLPAKGPQHAMRGRQMLLAFKAPNRGQAAAATAASNAAATAAGILPHTGFVPPGRPGAIRPQAQQQQQLQGGSNVFARLGGGPEEDRVRRLKAQGRYQPY